MPINKTQQGFVKTVVSCLLERQADEKLAPVTILPCEYDHHAIGFTSEVMPAHDFSKLFSGYTKTASRPIKVFGIVEQAGRYLVSSAILTPPNAAADEKSAGWSMRQQSEWDPATISKSTDSDANFNVCVAYLIQEMFKHTSASAAHVYKEGITDVINKWELVGETDNPAEMLTNAITKLQTTIAANAKPKPHDRLSPSKLSTSPSPSSFTTMPNGARSPVAANTKKPLQKNWQWTDFEKIISDNVKILNGNDEKAKPAAVKQLRDKILPFIKHGTMSCNITGNVERTKILELLRIAAASLAYGLTTFPEEKETDTEKRDRIENAAWMYYRRIRLPQDDKAPNIIGGTDAAADTKTVANTVAQIADIREIFASKISIDALVEFKRPHAIKSFGITRQYFIAMVNYAIVDKYLNSPTGASSTDIIAAAIVENFDKEPVTIEIRNGIVKLLAARSEADNVKPIFSNTVVARYLMVNCEHSKDITIDEKIKLYKAIADGSSSESLVARWHFIVLSLGKGAEAGQVKPNSHFDNVLKYINEASGDPEADLRFYLNHIKEFWAYAGKRIVGEKFLAILVKLSQQHDDYETQYWIYNDVAQVLFNGVSKDAAKQHVFFTYLRARGHGLCNMAASKMSVNKNVAKEIDATKAKLRDCLDSKDAKQSAAQRITNAAILLELPVTDQKVYRALDKEIKEIIDVIKSNLQLLVESCEIKHADKLWSFIQKDHSTHDGLEHFDVKKDILDTLADHPEIIHAVLAKLAASQSATKPELKTTRNAILTALFTHDKLKSIALDWAKINPKSNIWGQYGHEKINGRLLLLVALDAWKASGQQSALLNETDLLEWVDSQKTNYPGLLFAELAKEIYAHPSISNDTLFNVCKNKARASETDSTHMAAALDALTALEPQKLFELFKKVGADYKFSRFIQYCSDKVDEPAVANVDAKAPATLDLQSKTKIIAAFISALFCLRSLNSEPGLAAHHIKHIELNNGWEIIERIRPEPLEQEDIDKLLFFANSEDSAKAVWNVIAAKKSKLFVKADLARLTAIVLIKEGKAAVGHSKELLSFSKVSARAAFNALLAQPQAQIRQLFKATTSAYTLAEVLQNILTNPVLHLNEQQNKAERIAELFFCDEKAFASDKKNVKQFLLGMFEKTEDAVTKKANGNALIKILVHLEKLKSKGFVNDACLQNIKAVIKEETHLGNAIANCDAKEIVGPEARALLKELWCIPSWLNSLSPEQSTAFTKLLDENELKKKLEEYTAEIKKVQSNIDSTKARLQNAPAFAAQKALFTEAVTKPYIKQFRAWLVEQDNFDYDEKTIHTALNYAVIPSALRNRLPGHDKLEIFLLNLIQYKSPQLTKENTVEIAALAKAIANLFNILKTHNIFVSDHANIVEFICKHTNYAEFNAVVSLIWGAELAATKKSYDTLSRQEQDLATDIKRSDTTLSILKERRSTLITTALSDPDSFTRFSDKTLMALCKFYAVAKQVSEYEDVVAYTDPDSSGSVRKDAKRQEHAKQLVEKLSKLETAIGEKVLEHAELPLSTESHNKIKAFLSANDGTIATINAAVLAFQTKPDAAEGSVDTDFVTAAAILSAAQDSKQETANDLSKTAKELQFFVITKDYAAIARSIKALLAHNKNAFKLMELYVAITTTYNHDEQDKFWLVLNSPSEAVVHFNTWLAGNSQAQQNGWLRHFDNDIIKTVLAGDDKPALKAAKFINIIANKTKAQFNQALFNDCITLCANNANILIVLNVVTEAILNKPLNHSVTQNNLLEYLLGYLKTNSAYLAEILTGYFFKQIANLPAAKQLKEEPFKTQILNAAKTDMLTQPYCAGLIKLYSKSDLESVVKAQPNKHSAKILLLEMLLSPDHGPKLVENFEDLNKLMQRLDIGFTDLMTVYDTNGWSSVANIDLKHSPVESAALHTRAHLIPLFIMSKASAAVKFEDDKPAEKMYATTPKKQRSQATLASTPSQIKRVNFENNLADRKIECFAAGMLTTEFSEQGSYSSTYKIAIRPEFWLMLFEHELGRNIVKQLLFVSQPTQQVAGSLTQKSNSVFEKRKARTLVDIKELVKDAENVKRIWSALDKASLAQIDNMLAVFIENELITESDLFKLMVDKNLKNIAYQWLVKIVGNADLSIDAVNTAVAPLIKLLLTPVVDDRLFTNEMVKKWLVHQWSNLHNILNPAIGARAFSEFLIVLLKQKQFIDDLSDDNLNLMLGKITAQQFIEVLNNSPADKLLNAIPKFLENWTSGQSGIQQTEILLANENRALGELVKRYLVSIQTTATTSDLFTALEQNSALLHHEQIGAALKRVYQTPALLHAAIAHTKAQDAPGLDVRETVVNLAKKDNLIDAQFHNALGCVFFSSLTFDQKIAVGAAFKPPAKPVADEPQLTPKKLKSLNDFNECCDLAKEQAKSTAWWKYIPIIGVPGFYGLFRLAKAAAQWFGLVSSPKKPEVVFADAYKAMQSNGKIEIVVDGQPTNNAKTAADLGCTNVKSPGQATSCAQAALPVCTTAPIAIGAPRVSITTSNAVTGSVTSSINSRANYPNGTSTVSGALGAQTTQVGSIPAEKPRQLAF